MLKIDRCLRCNIQCWCLERCRCRPTCCLVLILIIRDLDIRHRFLRPALLHRHPLHWHFYHNTPPLSWSCVLHCTVNALYLSPAAFNACAASNFLLARDLLFFAMLTWCLVIFSRCSWRSPILLLFRASCNQVGQWDIAVVLGSFSNFLCLPFFFLTTGCGVSGGDGV
jgi:hypothetical protein